MHSANRTALIIAILLAVIVLTQIAYIVKSTYKIDLPGTVIWSLEALVFLAICVLALAAMVQKGPLTMAWAAIAVGGLLNVLQVGMGLAMFAPLSDAGEAMAPAYEAIVAGAFFLYFAGKLLFGVAAILVGKALLRSTGVARIAGGLAILTGLAAALVNTAALAMGMDWLYPAGAAGTVATACLAVALHFSARGPSPHPG
ncbi:hypothetical protein [Blastomonas sp. AAP53]|uniref:hypothetical protein n=1 Tax=Blastomonas sp. AAP53 TaxID=1248760 RepID=UPI0004781658|nr:hypothetical protein [Blastomonas sp. AAP53]